TDMFCSKYKADNFEKVLYKKFLGYTLKDIVKDKHMLVPSYNITKNKEAYFNNFPHPKDNLKDNLKDNPKDNLKDNPKDNPIYYNPIRFDPTVDYTDYSIVDVIRASTATPTYFPAKEINNNNYIDGGIFMNNPAYEVYI